MNVQQIAPGILYFPGFVDDPDAALVDVLDHVTFVQRSRKLYGRTVAPSQRRAWKRGLSLTCTPNGDTTMVDYETRAHEVISELCFAAWDAANPKRNGQRPKKHRPYHVPEVAQQLVTALGVRDAAQRESDVKALLLHHNYLRLTNGQD